MPSGPPGTAGARVGRQEGVHAQPGDGEFGPAGRLPGEPPRAARCTAAPARPRAPQRRSPGGRRPPRVHPRRHVGRGADRPGGPRLRRRLSPGGGAAHEAAVYGLERGRDLPAEPRWAALHPANGGARGRAQGRVYLELGGVRPASEAPRRRGPSHAPARRLRILEARGGGALPRSGRARIGRNDPAAHESFRTPDEWDLRDPLRVDPQGEARLHARLRGQSRPGLERVGRGRCLHRGRRQPPLQGWSLQRGGGSAGRAHGAGGGARADRARRNRIPRGANPGALAAQRSSRRSTTSWPTRTS
jgi:hypothetical protein